MTIRWTKRALLVAALCSVQAFGAQTPPSCVTGTAHPEAPMELAQFDFLIGDFDVELFAWAGSSWTPPRPGPHARWNGRYGLGGMAIIDEWYDPDPAVNSNAPRGINVRVFDPDSGEWKMMWVATAGMQVQDLRAAVRDGVLTMWQVYPERPDFKAEFRVDDEDHWNRVQYTRDEAGEWVPQFKLAASRIACG